MGIFGDLDNWITFKLFFIDYGALYQSPVVDFVLIFINMNLIRLEFKTIMINAAV